MKKLNGLLIVILLLTIGHVNINALNTSFDKIQATKDVLMGQLKKYKKMNEAEDVPLTEEDILYIKIFNETGDLALTKTFRKSAGFKERESLFRQLNMGQYTYLIYEDDYVISQGHLTIPHI